MCGLRYRCAVDLGGAGGFREVILVPKESRLTGAGRLEIVALVQIERKE
jgi:hypothetical protein